MFLQLSIILWGVGFPVCITGHMIRGSASRGSASMGNVGNYGIRSTSGRYASYWNEFLLIKYLHPRFSEGASNCFQSCGVLKYCIWKRVWLLGVTPKNDKESPIHIHNFQIISPIGCTQCAKAKKQRRF